MESDEFTYWAAKDGESVGDELVSRVNDWYQWVKSNKFAELVQRAYQQYYGVSKDGFYSHEVSRGGKKGEIAKVKSNHFRSTIQTILNLVTQTPSAFKSRAINTDYDAMAQIPLADGLIDYYTKEGGVNAKLRSCTEMGITFAEGWIDVDWNSRLGENYIQDEGGQTIKTGDIEVRCYDPLSVVRNLHNRSDNHTWLMTRNFKNKYDLLASYPHAAEQIMASEESRQLFQIEEIDLGLTGTFSNDQVTDSDMTEYYCFRHKISEAMPEGREILFLRDGTILRDKKFKYDTLHLFKISPGHLHNTPLSYSFSFDLLSLQNVNDVLNTSITTNQSTFGVQNIIAEKGAGTSLEQLEGGLNLIEINDGSQFPESLNLTSTPPEIFKYLDKNESDFNTHSGANDVTRGKAPPNVKAGNYAALLATQAVQFNSGLEQSYNEAAGSVATAIIELLRVEGRVERSTHMLGQSAARGLKSFIPEQDLANISKVVVDQVSATSKTIVGRTELADIMLQNGLITDANEYLAVRETGQPNLASQRKVDERLAIEDRVEAVRRGEKVPVILTDNHQLCIQHLAAVLHSPAARREPQLVQNVIQHIMEHEQAWLQLTQRPAIMAALGYSPAPVPPPPGPPPGGPNPGSAAPMQQGQPQQPNLPSLPQDAPPEAQQNLDKMEGM